ncbi:DUF4342 domain-containing protein [Candidatus Beckwithbacteria bacterium]|nr:DUF4342 domain-containing protein [Candidatus Beckwithbacteria bacterium]
MSVAKTRKTSSNKKSTRAKTSKKTQNTFKVKGVKLLEKVQELIKEGNVRRITILDKNGKTLIIIPLTIGVIGVVIAPVLAAVGAVAALVTECTIKVERK